MSENEKVHVDPTTGGRKAFNLQMVGLIPPEFILALAKHYGVGSQKYDKNNWRKGYDWEFSYNSAQRHLLAFWSGEDIDEETGSPHVIAAAWHCAALYIFMSEHPELDSRWSTVQALAKKKAESRDPWIPNISPSLPGGFIGGPASPAPYTINQSLQEDLFSEDSSLKGG